MTDRFKFRVWGIENKEYHSMNNIINNNGELGCASWTVGFIKYRDGLHVVEQCTGLKDKNGKLVYEGDIVFINGEKWRVIWSDEDCAFFFSNLKEVYHQPIYPDLYNHAEDFEVVGNIHENPELLK